ncbi:hypothetical protein AB4Z22_22760, partial [Paenibacillus sp. TAF58]
DDRYLTRSNTVGWNDNLALNTTIGKLIRVCSRECCKNTAFLVPTTLGKNSFRASALNKLGKRA